MTNPVAPTASTIPPKIDVQITEQNGAPTITFHRFLDALWRRTGGALGISSANVQTTANAASDTALTAQTIATNATNTANAAFADATTAQTSANTALLSAEAANTGVATLNTTAVLRANNLSDLNSLSISRRNLGVSLVPVTYTFDTLPAGLKRGIPIVMPLTVTANLGGTIVWWGVNTTNDAVFTLSLRSGPVIGQITLVHGGAGFTLSTQPPTSIAAGDVLIVSCPTDPTLAQVGITLGLSL